MKRANGMRETRSDIVAYRVRAVASKSWLIATVLGFALGGAVDVPARAQSQGDPQLDYMLQCQGCHMQDGTGKVEAGIPTLVGLGQRFLPIPGGRAYLVQVPGVNQAPLDDRAIAELMNWLLAHYRGKAAAPSFEPYTEEEVASLRSQPPIEVAATRARLLAGRASEPSKER